MTSSDLKIIMIDTYDVNSIGFADVSPYPTNFTVSNPVFQITVPQFPTINVPFTPKSANVYYADDLNIGNDNCTALPDGIYNIQFSINPSQNLSASFSFLRTYAIRCKYANIFLKIDLDCNCNIKTIQDQLNKLQEADLLINGAIAAANNADYLLSFKLYDKADKLLNKIVDCNCGTIKY